jgi:hypothetical protein
LVAVLAALFAVLPAPPAGAAKRTVRTVLLDLRDAGEIGAAAYTGYTDAYDAARRSVARLHGARRAELRAVVHNLDVVAAGGRLTAPRLALAFLTLRRNRQWWTTGPLLPYGRRVMFKGSQLVWQAYPGQGIQVQWLATFGRANAFFTGGARYDDRLRALLEEAAGLASPRAGGVAWEYWFRFDGGRPPWVSGLAQGTALQAFARAAVRLQDPSLFGVARTALGIFKTSPPEGVRLATPAGAHYLIYSFAPRTRVLNGFIQALNGLRDFAVLANDPEGRQLFADGEAQARVEVPDYDTGAWSLYQRRGRESDLGYHKLVRDFLQGLCTRLTEDGERAAQTGGVSSGAGAVPDPALYCDTAGRFTAYLRRPPRVVLQDGTHPPQRQGRPAAVRFTLSKVSTVTLIVTRGGRTVFARSLRFGRGRHSFGWGRPRRAGPYSVRVRAVDLAGNAGGASGVLHVRPKR